MRSRRAGVGCAVVGGWQHLRRRLLMAPARTVREAVNVLLGWLAALLLATGLLALTGTRPTDAL